MESNALNPNLTFIESGKILLILLLDSKLACEFMHIILAYGIIHA